MALYLTLWLKAYVLDELAERLQGCDWHKVADHLGLKDEAKRTIEVGGNVVYLRQHDLLVQVLRVWRDQPRSTVRILRLMLAELASDDAVRQLDMCRLSK